jgi:hypothetical protein
MIKARSDIFYREEIQCLISTVTDAIHKVPKDNVTALTALGHLHVKLSNMLPTAPVMADLIGAPGIKQ